MKAPGSDAFGVPFCRRNRPATDRLWAVAAVVALLLMLVLPGTVLPARAEEENKDEIDALISAQQLGISIQRALVSNKDELEELRVQLQQIEKLQAAVRAEIEAYESQNTVHGQLLLSTQFQLEDLEKALAENRLVTRVLAERIDKFQKRHEVMAALVQQSADRIEISRSQIANIRESHLGKEQKQKLESANHDLIKILEAKKELGNRYLEISSELLRGMTEALEEKKTIAAQLAALLESGRKASLFARVSPYQGLTWQYFAEMYRSLADNFRTLSNPAAWKAHWGIVRMVGPGRWIVFLVGLALVLFLQRRLRAYLRSFEKKHESAEWYYRRLAIILLRRSMFLLSLVVFFGVYTLLNSSLLMIGMGRVLFKLFGVLLVVRWGLDYLKHSYSGPPSEVRVFVYRVGRRFFHIFRVLCILIVLLSWFVGRNTSLVWMIRDILSVVLLVAALAFSRRLKSVATQGLREGQAAPKPKAIALQQVLSFSVIGGALLLNLLGYGNLAAHFFTASLDTAIMGFWGWIGLNAIREWHHGHLSQIQAGEEGESPESAHPWRWSIINLVRLLWLLLLAWGVLLTWDSAGYLRVQLVRIIGVTFTIGQINLSIKGILMAAAIIYLTRLAVVIGRSLLNHHVLENRELERGLKDSILTVVSYTGWGLGLLLALASIGVNATSLAVVFGALSVGIGFGLQNIFNNFISGLILLFERPIQVGDTVEVGGLMAEVKKINVRATVVQTFDNASVIIPNAEFISQRVTNWSFKDKRMRRNIEVGVAYGSDIELVQQTLMEIAQNHRKVLRYPKPDVVFIDHGASALTFRLRIWCLVDQYWSVPSTIRFEIDKRFRELGIEIAFPQQDLHIRSYPEEFKPRISATENHDTTETKTE